VNSFIFLWVGGFLWNATDVAELQELGKGHRFSSFYYHIPPDPVNNRTLNYYFPVDDHLALPCVLPIEIKIAYNSYSGDSSAFGEKWTFNHNIRVNKGRNRLEVLEGDGFQNVYHRERNLEAKAEAETNLVLVEQRKADAQAGGLKSNTVYEEMRRKLMSDDLYRDQLVTKFIPARPLVPGTYHSFARGITTLELKADGSFVRKFQNGTQEFFNSEGQIVRSQDRNGNYITYVYQDNNLSRINDMCSRSVSFFYYQDQARKGLLQSLKDSLDREIKYEFHPGSKRLKSYSDFSGRVVTFDYDKNGNVTELTSTRPDDILKKVDRITLKYNDKFEVTEQVGPGTKVSRFSRTFVANNPNHSITEIQKFDGKTPEGKELHEYKLRDFETVTKFDSKGKEISREIKKISASTGYPESVLDAQGQGEKFRYDSVTGHLIERESVPSGDAMIMEYLERCNQIQKITNQNSKTKAVKSVMTFQFDDRCNLREVKETRGEAVSALLKLEFFPTGKISFLREQVSKREIAFTYWEFGKPNSITLRDRGTLLVKYQPDGTISSVETIPHGKAKKEFEGKDKTAAQGQILGDVRTALNEFFQYLRPAGLNIGL
jgi:YD repeat-containing protein